MSFSGPRIAGTRTTRARRSTARRARTATVPSTSFAGALGSPPLPLCARTTETTLLRITGPAAWEFGWSGILRRDRAHRSFGVLAPVHGRLAVGGGTGRGRRPSSDDQA